MSSTPIRNALYFHEMNTKSKAIDKLSIENLTQSHTITSQRNALVLLIIFLVVFLVMFVVIARQKHLLSKSNQVLFDKSQEDIITKNAYVQSIQSMKAKIQELQQQAEGGRKTPRWSSKRRKSLKGKWCRHMTHCRKTMKSKKRPPVCPRSCATSSSIPSFR